MIYYFGIHTNLIIYTYINAEDVKKREKKIVGENREREEALHKRCVLLYTKKIPCC